ncbi:MAG: hypothetical protein AAFX81_19450 [Pseudomonadota bacterium]
MSGGDHWSRRQEIGGPALIEFALRTLPTMPPALSSTIIWLIALVMTAAPGRAANAASRSYLERALGREPRFGDVLRQTVTFSHVLLDRARLLTRGTQGFAIDVQGGEVVRQCVAAGRGGVLLGAHFGSFEALRAAEEWLPGLRVRYLMFTRHASHSHGALSRLNPDVAARVIDLGDGPLAMLSVVEALSTGEFVAFLGDRSPAQGILREVRAPFFGAPMAVPASPYAAAMVAGAPIILCFAPRIGPMRYAARFTQLHDGAPTPRAERRELTQQLAERYVAELETLCRHHPYNWFNFHDVWSHGV